MIYDSIGDKPLVKLDYNVLRDFFNEKVFDQFMEHGRVGLSQVSEDLVHTLAEYCRVRSAPLAKVHLSVADEETIIRHARKELMHTLITCGTHEFIHAIGSVYNLIINTMRDTAEGRK